MLAHHVFHSIKYDSFKPGQNAASSSAASQPNKTAQSSQFWDLVVKLDQSKNKSSKLTSSTQLLSSGFSRNNNGPTTSAAANQDGSSMYEIYSISQLKIRH